MKIFVKQAKSPEEKERTFKLLFDVFMERFKFDYKKVAALMPDFEKVILYTTDEKDRILSTASISSANQNGKFPSEVLFDFKADAIVKNSRIVELGRFAKVKNWTMNPQMNRLPFLALLLGIIQYTQQNQIDAWVGSVYTRFFDDIQDLGIPLTILQTGVQTDDEATLERLIHVGDYLEGNDVHFVYSPMEAAYQALREYRYLVDAGLIQLDLNS